MTPLQPPKTLQDLMTVTGLGKYAVKSAIRNGQLPGYKTGRFYVVPADAFAAFCNGTWVPRELPKPEPIRPIAPPQMLNRRVS